MTDRVVIAEETSTQGVLKIAGAEANSHATLYSSGQTVGVRVQVGGGSAYFLDTSFHPGATLLNSQAAGIMMIGVGRAVSNVSAGVLVANSQGYDLRSFELHKSNLSRRLEIAITASYNEAILNYEEDNDEPYPDEQIWLAGAQFLKAVLSVNNAPLPSLLPLHGGGLSAEWHDANLNIELRFRTTSSVYCLIEDGACVVPGFSNFNPDVTTVASAVASLIARLASTSSLQLASAIGGVRLYSYD